MMEREQVGNVSHEKGTVWDEAASMIAALARVESQRVTIDPGLDDLRVQDNSSGTAFALVYGWHPDEIVLAEFPNQRDALNLLEKLQLVRVREESRVLWDFAELLDTLARGGYRP